MVLVEDLLNPSAASGHKTQTKEAGSKPQLILYGCEMPWLAKALSPFLGNSMMKMSSSPWSLLSVRSFGTKKKSKKKTAKKQPKSAASSTTEGATTTTTTTSAVALQHEEWVKFQQSIAVQGFETGQTMQAFASATSKSSRQSVARQRKKAQAAVQERLKERQRLTVVGGGEYPPLRYSDDETERLLAEAYAAVPPRAGKRGTRNAKRQAKRWHLVRLIRKQYKRHLAKFQQRKMIKRSETMQAVKQVLYDAPEQRQRDRLYQAYVLEQWAKRMVSDQQEAN